MNEASSLSQNQVKALKPGQLVEIASFTGDQIIMERLRELGLHMGSQLRFVRQAPFGGPCLFQLSTTLLALREEELACLKFKAMS